MAKIIKSNVKLYYRNKLAAGGGGVVEEGPLLGLWFQMGEEVPRPLPPVWDVRHCSSGGDVHVVLRQGMAAN